MDPLEAKAKASRSYQGLKALLLTHRHPSSSGAATKQKKGCSWHGTGRGKSMENSTQSALGRQNQVWKGLGGRQTTMAHAKIAPTSREKSKAGSEKRAWWL